MSSCWQPEVHHEARNEPLAVKERLQLRQIVAVSNSPTPIAAVKYA
jgi:hypothetical protein